MKQPEILKLLTQDDIEARTAFTKNFDSEINTISVLCAEGFQLVEQSDCAQDQSHRAALVSGFLTLAVESVLSATQLSSLGHIAPAGNSMRISYEALCMSALLKKDCDLQVENGSHRFNFYDEYCKKAKCARADKSVSLFIKNSELLGLGESGAKFMKGAKVFYNGYSHAGDLLIHSKIKPSTLQMYVGGGYDQEQQSFYAEHIKFIIRFAKHIPYWIKAIAYNAT